MRGGRSLGKANAAPPTPTMDIFHLRGGRSRTGVSATCAPSSCHPRLLSARSQPLTIIGQSIIAHQGGQKNALRHAQAFEACLPYRARPAISFIQCLLASYHKRTIFCNSLTMQHYNLAQNPITLFYIAFASAIRNRSPNSVYLILAPFGSN